VQGQSDGEMTVYNINGTQLNTHEKSKLQQIPHTSYRI
jgi:hypothetical protein